MKECIEREAALEAVDNADVMCDIHADAYRVLRRYIERIPAADVVPVVRCKDCQNGIPYATVYSCYGILHKPDWFCAGGVRKDGDGE